MALGGFQFPSSTLDGCVFIFFDPESKVWAGTLCLHVDDLLCFCAQAIVKQSMHCVHLSRFASGKEIKENSVAAAFHRMFSPKRSLCLSVHTLCKSTKVTVRAQAQPEDKATPAEIRSLRECNGAVQWLAKECRPHLAVQVSLSQQTLSDPRVRHCRQANAMVRRAKQHHEWTWRFLPIPLKKDDW